MSLLRRQRITGKRTHNTREYGPWHVRSPRASSTRDSSPARRGRTTAAKIHELARYCRSSSNETSLVVFSSLRSQTLDIYLLCRNLFQNYRNNLSPSIWVGYTRIGKCAIQQPRSCRNAQICLRGTVQCRAWLALVWRRLATSGKNALFGVKVVICVIGFYEPFSFFYWVVKNNICLTTYHRLSGSRTWRSQKNVAFSSELPLSSFRSLGNKWLSDHTHRYYKRQIRKSYDLLSPPFTL